MTGQCKLMWINLQGADWALLKPLMEAGVLPHLSKLVQDGCYGQLFAVPPRRNPTSAITLATGVKPQDHGVVAPVVADASCEAGLRPVGRRDWRAQPVWEHLAAAGLKATAVGWPATHLGHSGNAATVVSDTFLMADGSDRDAWEVAEGSVSAGLDRAVLAEMRLHPKDVTAEMLAPFLSAAETIDVTTDDRLQTLVEALTRAVTAQRVAMKLAEETDWDLICVNFDFLDILSHRFLQYQAPRMGHVTTADFARYAGVVTAAYKHIDTCLAALLSVGGDDANVIVTSDYGYLTGDLRKRPSETTHGRAHLETREQVVFIAKGSAFAPGALQSGLMTTSVAPTVLAAFGFNATDGMSQAPIGERLHAGHDALRPLPSIGPQAFPVQKSAPTAALELGYLKRRGVLPPLSANREATIETLKVTHLTRLAQCHIADQANGPALSQLEAALAVAPNRADVHLLIAQCCVAEKNWSRAAEALETIDLLDADMPMAACLRGRVAQAAGDLDEARRQFAVAVADAEDTIEDCRMLETVGMAYLNMQDYQPAVEAFQSALAISKVAPRALAGLGAVHLASQAYQEALTCLDGSLAVLQQQPRTQTLRGYALLGLDRTSEARSAFETALAIAPDFALAKKGLAELAEATVPGKQPS